MLEVRSRGRSIGESRPDVIVQNAVIVELKVARALAAVHDVQLLTHLRATGIEVGLLLNFGPEPRSRRVVFANDRKAPGTYARPSA